MLDNGSRISPWLTLIRPLPGGGMADVWLARDDDRGERVVVKLLPDDAPEEAAELLRREQELTARLDHPAIVPALGWHRVEGREFLILAYAGERHLGSLRRRPLGEILPALLPLLDALEHAHGRGVIHRDLKAENILWSPADGPRLTDFGVAGTPQDAPLARGGGSPYSMSPQQLAGDPPIPADDVYGLGTLLYDLLAGQPPFWPSIRDEDIRESLPADLPAAVPGDLAAWVRRMLAKDPADRPDLQEVRAGLLSLAGELGIDLTQRTKNQTLPPSLTPPPRPQAGAPILAPPTLPRPGVPRRPAGQQRSRWGMWLAAGLLGVLALTAVGVFVVLPDWVAQRQALQQETTGIEEEVPATPTDAPVAAERTDGGAARPELDPQTVAAARQRLEDLWNRLRQQQVDAWGGETLAAARRRTADGDGALERGDLATASAAFDDAAAGLRSLDGRAANLLRQALEDGRRALAQQDAPAAKRAFRRALDLRPGHGGAQAGLRRAEVLPQVQALLAEGAEHARQGRWQAAEGSYREAQRLDSASGAGAALERLELARQDDAFGRAVAEGLAALDQSHWQAARDAFGRAAALRPTAPEIADGLAQAEAGERRDALAELRRQAQAFEEQERWHQAAASYEQALKIDGSVEFAQVGGRRARARAGLADRLDAYLARPQRLSAAAVLAEAEAVLAEAKDTEPSGPRLLQQIEQLEQQIQGFAVPVRATLRSDRETEVVVYRVGKLGKFDSKTLELTPGTYTVVGSRPGYRDVRLQWVIEPGTEPSPLPVRCEEKI